MTQYPFYILEDGPLEVIASGPNRFRLFWDGKYVCSGKYLTGLLNYVKKEFE
jgi:hypothetical protein